ncbi:hypothetical protein Hamer_G010401 [Homarus americanus]|uniref:Uncharacterized protein n=1 Tax=Homarus americanus TaxID=6706 RepID=A0A8J5MWZ6_HOMAM|nr:hypothetical protein Hamer_G010401 [Homarus americanus]
MGDFNQETLDWVNLTTHAKGEEFLYLIQDLFLTQHMSEPTRGDIILDLVLMTEEAMVDEVHTGKPNSGQQPLHTKMEYNL